MKGNIFRKAEKLCIILIIMANIIFLACMSYRYIQTHFLWNTTINGISCSFLTIDDVVDKMNKEKENENLVLSFIDGKTHTISLKECGIVVDREKIEKVFQQNHSQLQEIYQYSISQCFILDMEQVSKICKQIPNLQEENMIKPQDAYIVWDNSTFSIQKEIEGNVIDFGEALNLITETINQGEYYVDFSLITTVKPDINEKDLEYECEKLNAILNSSINYELTDGSNVTLDSNIIKNWVYQDDNGGFQFDIENGVLQFVEELDKRVGETNNILHFNATDLSTDVFVNIPENLQVQLNKEKEILNIKNLLGSSEKISCKPNYVGNSLSDMLISYVELDISRQHLWFYLNGELLFDTPCVTGNPRYGYNTPQGVFFLLNKDRNALLEGSNADGSKYSTKVEYWMRFYQGYGFHDAWWRTTFGEEIYKTNGSHGCVNMPTEMAAKMFEVIDNTMPIIIYQS